MKLSIPDFKPIETLAIQRLGSLNELKQQFHLVRSQSELQAVTNDRWLSDLSRRVFQAGFNWSVINRKWPDFEIVFDGFDLHRWAHMSDADFDRLYAEPRIVRHARKILSVRDNAVFLLDLVEAHGSVGQFIADWPADDIIRLIWLLRKHGAGVGLNAAQAFLRGMGKDTFMLTRDTMTALIREGVFDQYTRREMPTAKRDWQIAQQVFLHWQQQTGYTLSQLSQITAFSLQ